MMQEQMQMQMGAASALAGGGGGDVSKAYESERESLELLRHDWALHDVEARLIHADAHTHSDNHKRQKKTK